MENEDDPNTWEAIILSLEDEHETTPEKDPDFTADEIRWFERFEWWSKQ